MSLKTVSTFVLGLSFSLPSAGTDASLAITNVTVIDTTGGPNRPGMTVVLEGNRIVAVAPTRRASLPKSARAVDGSGKFLIPGLWDMHIHAFFGDWVPGGREVTLPLLLANGVTGVRDMGSDLEPILAARSDVDSGKLLGPRMVVSGPMLDGPKSQFPSSIALRLPRTAGERSRRSTGSGVDFIKIQSYVARDVYLAVADECRSAASPSRVTCPTPCGPEKPATPG